MSPEEKAKFDAITAKYNYKPAPSVASDWYTVTTPKAKAPEKPSLGTRIKTDITEAGEKVQQAIAGEGEFVGQTPVRRGVEATAEAFRAVPKVAGEVMPEPIRKGVEKVGETVGGAVNWLTDKLGSTQLAQDFVTKHPEAAKTLEEVLGTAAPAGEIAGTILAAGTVKPTVDIAKAGGAKVLEATKPVIETGMKIPSAIGEKLQGARTKMISGIEKLVAKDIPKPVQTVLKESTDEQFNNYATLAQKAAESNKAITPLEFAGTRAQDGLDVIQRKLSTLGSEKSSVMAKASVGNKPVGNIVLKFRQDLKNALSKKTSIDADKKVYSDIMSEAEKLGNNPRAADVDKFIDFAQDRIYSAKRDLTVPVSDDVEKILRPITGKLNESLKNQLPTSYRNLNQKYADLVGLRNELNTKLGFEGEKGGSLMKRVFSPSDANTKKMFESVLKETGIDLVNEATLAKFVMEVMGDARQMSLLEQLKLPRLTKSGILDFLSEKATARFNTPEAQIKRAQELIGSK